MEHILCHLGAFPPRSFFLRKLLGREFGRLEVNNRSCHLPDLKKIVLSGAAYKPVIIEIPAEVGKVIDMAAMHEEPACKLALT